MSGCTRARAILATCAGGAAVVPAAAVLPTPLALLAAVVAGSAVASVSLRQVPTSAAASGGL